MKAGLSRLSGHLVYLVQPNKPNKPNRPDRPSVSLQPAPLHPFSLVACLSLQIEKRNPNGELQYLGPALYHANYEDLQKVYEEGK